MTSNEIKGIINNRLILSGEAIVSDFVYGEFVDVPNNRGVFQIKGRWFIYETDERNVKSITGPFQDKEIIYACVKLMNKSKYFEDYRFSKEAKNMYIHVHYRGLAEVEENIF